MKSFKRYSHLIVFFYACQKNNGSISPANSPLVKTITSKTRKIDTSGRSYTVVDYFQYDQSKRVIKYIRIGYDTSLLYDAFANITALTPNLTQSIDTLSYTGQQSIPASYTVNGQLAYLTANVQSQIATDSRSPAEATRYYYTSGLLAGRFENMDPYYSMDSTSINANKNVNSIVVGGNYLAGSLNRPIYGRIASWNYGYGNICNPEFTNASASAILFLFTNHFPGKYIAESMEYICYGRNSVIAKDEVSHFRNAVDGNNIIQKSVNIQTMNSLHRHTIKSYAWPLL